MLVKAPHSARGNFIFYSMKEEKICVCFRAHRHNAVRKQLLTIVAFQCEILHWRIAKWAWAKSIDCTWIVLFWRLPKKFYQPRFSSSYYWKVRPVIFCFNFFRTKNLREKRNNLMNKVSKITSTPIQFFDDIFHRFLNDSRHASI